MANSAKSAGDLLLAPLTAGDVFAIQRQLRAALLDRSAIRHAPARDLAAHMLLHLDDLPSCWALATNWLRSELDCQRVDTGFGRPDVRDYLPGFAEAKNADYDVPSFGGTAVDNRDPIMQAMWHGSRAIIFADIKQDRCLTAGMRKRLSGARTQSKFGAALRNRNGTYGLICADWTEHFVPNEARLYDCFEQTTAEVLSPIIAVAKQISDLHPYVRETGDETVAPSIFRLANPALLAGLTSSEVEVVRPVASGMSYKEIARTRGRAVSTIDHQLRSIRCRCCHVNLRAIACVSGGA